MNMDSCHIFNFLFGSRKATSELSKHFKASFNEINNNDNKHSKRTRTIADKKLGESSGIQNKCEPHTEPESPLKQIQRKISNLTNPSQKLPPKIDCCHTECDPTSKCGTYRANLVEPTESCELLDENNNNNETTTVNKTETSKQEQTQAYPLYCKPIIEHIVFYDNDNDSYLKQERPDQINRSQREFYEIKANDTRTISDQQAFAVGLQNVQPKTRQDKSTEDDNNTSGKSECQKRREDFEARRVARSEKVKELVQSFELSTVNKQKSSELFDTPRTPIKLKWPPEQNIQQQHKLNNDDRQTKEKPTTIVKPLPPKTPPKSKKAKFINLQLRISKPTKIEQLFLDEQFLIKFFDKLEPIDRCAAAQVCRTWRNILYSNQYYWRDLISVIDCIQLRREHLLECIVSTLQSAKLRHLTHSAHSGASHYYGAQQQNGHHPLNNKQASNDSSLVSSQSHASILQHRQQCQMDIDTTDLDQDEVWKIQELCQKFARGSNSYSSRSLINEHQHNGPNQYQHDNHQAITPKSSSIPSQISSTISSASLSSLLSPLSESSRVDSIKKRLYAALDDRGFDAICLYGASDDDIQDLVHKTPPGTHKRILVGRLDNCCVTDKGLELFMMTFNQIKELELSGCNEISNAIDFRILKNLQHLIITDCINIADGLASRLVHVFEQLTEMTIQAYHLTDSFLEYIHLNSNTDNLKLLGLPNCKELTNQSMLTIAECFSNVEHLSISGSTKISDDGIEILREQAKNLKSLDLSWCTKISDISLEFIACDLSTSLSELVLDRNVNITDIGLGYLTSMKNLTLLYIRWCPRITDVGLMSVLNVKTLRNLSLAGLHQITARSLLCLVEATSLEEVELTNCPAVNNDLYEFLSSKMPKCNIIF